MAMAMAILDVIAVPRSSLRLTHHHRTLNASSPHHLLRQPPPLPFHVLKQQRKSKKHPGLRKACCVVVVCVSAPAVIINEEQANNRAVDSTELLACPICFEPLLRRGPLGVNISAISRSAFSCKKCKKTYSNREVYLDLTVTAGSKTFKEVQPAGTELFRNPWVSFVYERGWRQSFSTSGFPGPDEELNMAQGFFKPRFGGVLLDVSCGSGLFSRRFVQSGAYSTIIALDYSENMLRQCYEFIKQDKSITTETIALVRADVARLPFASETIDAIHAGAALHCWPSPSSGVAEISRILRPGGIFVASTFLRPSNLGTELLKPLRQIFGQSFSRNVRYWEESELEDLVRSCGLVRYKSIRRGSFIMLSAKKPD
ncbi:hypothetical protein O6H91_06G071100 [Diphasiastrum complanatum]|uniref:Uncharacterized protein n=1 Tax=Diphasiastrum complanatum TaxID=34168 RepID=A0ACC2DFC6_DIPCM|nr:hypothetical protein O6H91_06G071100 [Diphasiastrum complanatum]